jgi:hypothetical protein
VEIEGALHGAMDLTHKHPRVGVQGDLNHQITSFVTKGKALLSAPCALDLRLCPQFTDSNAFPHKKPKLNSTMGMFLISSL